jgi:hypothetical protein
VQNTKYDLSWEIQQIEDAISYYEYIAESFPDKYVCVQRTMNKLYQRIVNLKYDRQTDQMG